MAYRGGNWNNGANAGVFYLNLNNARSNSNTNLGFRSALRIWQKAMTHGLSSRPQGIKGFVSLLKSKKHVARKAVSR